MCSGVVFAGFLSVVLSLKVIAVRQMRVMATLFVVARFVVLSSNAMVLGSVLVVLCCFKMVVDTFLGHMNPLTRYSEPATTDV